jgi:hypothetical protein
VHTPHPLPLIVVVDTAFLAPKDFYVAGVEIDRRRATQSVPSHRGHPLEHPLGHLRDPGLHCSPLWIGEPACQPSSGSRGQPRHRCDHLPRHISTLPVQPDQEILPSKLRRSQPHQHLTSPEPAIPLLDRTHRRIQRRDHTQPLHQLRHRSHPRHRRQHRVRRAHPHPRPPTT